MSRFWKLTEELLPRSGSRKAIPEIYTEPGLPEVVAEDVTVGDASRLIVHTNRRGLESARFRYLRMRLCEIREAAPMKGVVITSALPGEGKSTVAMNLATALSEGQAHQTLVVEADLHNPTLAGSLGIEPRDGLAECLEDGADPIASIRRLNPLGWCLLQAGQPRRNPTELLQSDALPKLMRSVSSRFDWVLIDAPPVAPISDALLLANQADGVLFVIRADHTPREAVEEALARLNKDRVLGIVLNGVEDLSHLDSHYPEYYGEKRRSSRQDR